MSALNIVLFFYYKQILIRSEQNILRDHQGLIRIDQKAIKAAQLAMREGIGRLISAQHLIKADQGLILQEFRDGKEDLSKLNLDLHQLRKTQQGFKEQLLLIKDGQAKLLEMLNKLNSTAQ